MGTLESPSATNLGSSAANVFRERYPRSIPMRPFPELINGKSDFFRRG
jgi:hypothetical protein